MLTMVRQSGDKKTGKIAVTYRAGINLFGTCPATCAQNPQKAQSTGAIDWRYFDAVAESAPIGGGAWTYCHFEWRKWVPRLAKLGDRVRTTFNFSADTFNQARDAVKHNVPTTIVVPEDWHATGKVRVVDTVRYVQCPATVKKNEGKVTCSGVGGTVGCGGDKPLCMRDKRDYVITFPLHGVFKRKAAPCYAAGGKVRLAWERTKDKPQSDDAKDLRAWVTTLPHGSLLRHHVAGDVGKV